MFTLHANVRKQLFASSPSISPPQKPLSHAFAVRSNIYFPSLRSNHQTLICSSHKMAPESAYKNLTGDKRDVKIHDSEEDLAVNLAKYISDLSNKFVARSGAFTVVLSGGSLIKALRKLLEPPYIDSVEWGKWHVFWADERVVAKDHEDSNYKLSYDGFLSKIPILPEHVYSINDTLSAEGAAEDYEACLKHLVTKNVLNVSPVSSFPKFDLVLLGMGPDGHVASLFPDHHLLNENKKWVAFIKDSPKPPPERITFTFPVINSSAYVALVAAGAGKSEPINITLGNGQSHNSGLLPVQIVSPEDEITWFLDKSAASKL